MPRSAEGHECRSLARRLEIGHWQSSDTRASTATMPKADRSPGLSSERPTSASQRHAQRRETHHGHEVGDREPPRARSEGKPSTGGFFTAFILPSRQHAFEPTMGARSCAEVPRSRPCADARVARRRHRDKLQSSSRGPQEESQAPRTGDGVCGLATPRVRRVDHDHPGHGGLNRRGPPARAHGQSQQRASCDP